MVLSEMQEEVREFTKEKKLNATVDIRIIDLVSEVGELAKEVLKGTNYGTEDFMVTDEWKTEIGDVLFSLICIANETDVDLEQSLRTVLNKYKKRFNQKGNIGSD